MLRRELVWGGLVIVGFDVHMMCTSRNDNPLVNNCNKKLNISPFRVIKVGYFY